MSPFHSTLTKTAETIDVMLDPDGPQSEALAADISQALNASPEAETFFQCVAPFYRKNFLRWIDQARRPETRAARNAEMVTMLEACVHGARTAGVKRWPNVSTKA